MSSSFGKNFVVTTFGESHGSGVGVIVDGVPAGMKLTEADVQVELDKRRPGTSEFVSPRNEPDKVEILSGTFKGETIGSPIAMMVRNLNHRSSDYDNIKDYFRPGHSDFTYFKRYGTMPLPGGGRSSARETIGRVAGGAVARLVLGESVKFNSCSSRIGKVEGKRIDWEFAKGHPLRFGDPDLADQAIEEVREAMERRDSVGGKLSINITGVPVGLGDPTFRKLDALLAMGIMSIGAVKGIEIGAGFNVCSSYGSKNNDPITEDGFSSNNAGGMLGGISTGQDININVALKPTSSIMHKQNTISAIDGKNKSIQVVGRHDPCLCPRACIVVEAMAAMVLADLLLEGTNKNSY
jgi:chorismate synthase